MQLPVPHSQPPQSLSTPPRENILIIITITYLTTIPEITFHATHRKTLWSNPLPPLQLPHTNRLKDGNSLVNSLRALKSENSKSRRLSLTEESRIMLKCYFMCHDIYDVPALVTRN